VFDNFKEYLQGKITLSEEELAYIEKFARYKKLRKKQYLLQEGDICKQHAFVAKGLMRAYSVDEKGSEHITRFAREDWWISDRESLLSGHPSRFNIDAIEASDLILFDKDEFDVICQKLPVFNQLITNVLNKSFVVYQDRVHEAISTTADEKYHNFMRRYPEYSLRVPQAMIASYLGMTPETLSRLRNPKSKK